MATDDGIFPSRTGTPQGASTENRMLGKVGADSIRTVVQNNPDGTTTTLRTRGGAPDFVTSPADAVGDRLKFFMGLCKQPPPCAPADATQKPTSTSVVRARRVALDGNVSCDGIFSAWTSKGGGVQRESSVLCVRKHLGGLPYVARLEYLPGEIVEMPVTLSAGKVATFGNPWHGTIDSVGRLTLPNGAYCKGLTNAVLFLPPGRQYITMVDFGGAGLTPSAEEDEAGLRWDAYALLQGQNKSYGVDETFQAGKLGWYFKADDGSVWNLRVVYDTDSMTVEARPTGNSMDTWITLATVSLPTYRKFTAVEDVITHSADGSVTVLNVMTYWYTSMATTADPATNYSSENYVARRASLIAQIDVAAADGMPTAAISVEADAGYAASAYFAPVRNAIWFPPEVCESSFYTGPAAAVGVWPIAAYTTTPVNTTSTAEATLLIGKYVTPDGVVGAVSVRQESTVETADTPGFTDWNGEVWTQRVVNMLGKYYLTMGGTEHALCQITNQTDETAYYRIEPDWYGPGMPRTFTTNSLVFGVPNTFVGYGEANCTVNATFSASQSYSPPPVIVQFSGNNAVVARVYVPSDTGLTFTAFSILGGTYSKPTATFEQVAVNPATGAFSASGGFL